MRQSMIPAWLLVGVMSVGMPLVATAQGPTTEQRLSLGSPGSQIGVSIRELRDADLAAAKLTRPEGVFIESVSPGTPAERAGLKSADIVVEYDGERVRGSRHFARLVQETPAGRAVQLTVNRGGTRQALTVTPEEGRSSIDLEDLRERIERRLPDLPFGLGRAAERRLGVTLVPLSAQLAAYFGVANGVLVSDVVADSPASRASLKAGDVITALNGRNVGSPADVSEGLRAMAAGATADVTVMRDKREVRAKVNLGESARGTRRGTVGI
jgi:serine protease Do